jgi:hypothetical protein
MNRPSYPHSRRLGLGKPPISVWLPSLRSSEMWWKGNTSVKLIMREAPVAEHTRGCVPAWQSATRCSAPIPFSSCWSRPLKGPVAQTRAGGVFLGKKKPRTKGDSGAASSLEGECGSIFDSSLSAKERAVARASLAPPALSERCHRSLARLRIAVSRALDMPATAARPHLGAALRSDCI